MSPPPRQEEGHRPTPDRKALRLIGDRVRKRLMQDPGAYRVPVDSAEIFAFADFLDAHECAHLMRMIDEVALPSRITRTADPDFRTSYSGDIDPSDPVVRTLERRLYDLTNIEPTWGESVQGQRYHPGQQFKEHCDWFDTNQEYWKHEAQTGGQRSWTAMVYLNDVEAGGVTAFTRIGVTIPPQAGALLVWNNNGPDGAVNWNTMHAALPVERGEKYVVTKWFRSRRWGA
ncbi:prolyl 4-hydroxylase [Novosphingobium fluoreni]|uniref:Prolyl 4-hydroxylase n=1 Tax=Novosphingobium fluoreni TaxID=1391222 RepID=A0A7W6C7B4_9SPHN|nr:2OG-Fe(II) oxygenase [Novosphingobium fluoreni]MBB3939747.1 prolyl 4-hydroxylase [Novosphingobium fluoreni]